ncbi:MAG: aminopeptidase [Capsulimonadaceae bacterium]
MHDTRLTKWADTLIRYSIEARPGQQILIRADEAGIPLAREVYRAALAAGGHPHIHVLVDGVDEIFYSTATDPQLDFVSPIRKLEYETIDALVAIVAPANTAELSGVDPARQARAQSANREIRSGFFHRAADNRARWVLTLYPTPAAAQNAGLSVRAYEEFVLSAMFLDQADPPAAWREFSVRQQHYVDTLNRVREIRFVAKDTDISMRVEGRSWMNSDGHRNFPSGEVFTGPIEDSVNGFVRFTFPGAHLGHEVDDIRLKFENGRVVDFDAARGRDFLRAMLASDPGAMTLGECAIGNNYGVQRFSRNTLFDEKIGGTFHLALGNSYPETGGKNVSSLHWDMICDMRPDAGGGAVYADGVVIHENGQWTI